MRLILALVLLNLSSAFAEDLSMGISDSNNLILSSKSCEQLIKQHTAICSWKKSIETDFIEPKIDKDSCIKSATGIYKTIVSSCLPSFVKKYQHKKLFKSGANCWGTAMNFKNISSKPRFVWSEEMSYWQDSPICRKLDIGEELRPGDILNIYGPEFIFNSNEQSKGTKFWEALYPNRLTPSSVMNNYSGFHNFLHSETYVTGDLAFGKNSPAQDDLFEFHSMHEVYGRSNDKECQENQSLEPHNREYQNPPRNINGSKCDYFSLAYRCQSFSQYFSTQTISDQDKKILEKIEELQKMQVQLFDLLTVANKKITPIEIKQMIKQSDLDALESLEALGRLKLDKNTEMLLVLKYFSASGIRKSFELAEMIPASEAL